MTKQTPSWSGGVKVAKPVKPTPATGNKPAPTPHFVPVKAPGKPAAGIDLRFGRNPRG